MTSKRSPKDQKKFGFFKNIFLRTYNEPPEDQQNGGIFKNIKNMDLQTTNCYQKTNRNVDLFKTLETSKGPTKRVVCKYFFTNLQKTYRTFFKYISNIFFKYIFKGSLIDRNVDFVRTFKDITGTWIFKGF